MNTIDLIVCLVLVVAVWCGFRRGLILQVCSLAGIVLGIWLAARYGAEVGALLLLEERFAAAGGFITVLVVVILAVALLGRLLRKLFHFAGFGVPDVALGIVVSVAKYLLVVSVLFSAFDTLNADYSLVDRRTIARSKSYGPVLRISQWMLPRLKQAGTEVTMPELPRLEELVPDKERGTGAAKEHSGKPVSGSEQAPDLETC